MEHAVEVLSKSASRAINLPRHTALRNRRYIDADVWNEYTLTIYFTAIIYFVARTTASPLLEINPSHTSVNVRFSDGTGASI